jgi:AraC-like DNA-binding protein
MIVVRHQAPSPPLSAFVDIVWLCEMPPQPWSQERLLPDGTLQLVVDLSGRDGYGVIAGPHAHFFVLDTTHYMDLVGVHFRPGGAFPFLGLPVHELRDLDVPLESLWGSLARELTDRLLEARTDDEKFAIVEAVLLRRARARFDRHPAVAYALSHFTRVPHTRTIAQVSQQIGLSQRRFIEVFSSEVGLTPKLFCRIRRFQSAMRRVHSRERVNWSEVAQACGYFDQAHFIHDFQAFSGLNPSVWLAQRTEHVNHVPIRD